VINSSNASGTGQQCSGRTGSKYSRGETRERGQQHPIPRIRLDQAPGFGADGVGLEVAQHDVVLVTVNGDAIDRIGLATPRSERVQRGAHVTLHRQALQAARKVGRRQLDLLAPLAVSERRAQPQHALAAGQEGHEPAATLADQQAPAGRQVDDLVVEAIAAEEGSDVFDADRVYGRSFSGR
jgi:hypothetical protein